MATTESMGLLTFIDQNGNKVLMYPVTKAELVDGLDEAAAAKVKEALDSALDTALAGKLDKTGGSMTGDIDFGQSSKGLWWECANGDKYWLRPWSDTNVFQLVRENPATGLSQYGVLNVNSDGSIQLNGPLTADSFTGEVKWSNLKDVPSYLATVGGEMSGQITARNVPGFSDFAAISDSIGCDAGFMAQNTQTNMAASFGVASNGALAGIYDHIGQQWMMCRPAGTKDTYFAGDNILVNNSPVITANGATSMASNLNFGQSYSGPYWQCSNGYEYVLRPLADGCCQLMKRNPSTGEEWHEIFGVQANDNITLGGTMYLHNYIDFGQSNSGLGWQCANGDVYHLRAYSPNSVLQLTRQNPNGLSEYAVMTVSTDGGIVFGVPNGDTINSTFGISKDAIYGNLIGKVNGYSFSAQTTDPGAGSALADGQVLFVYQ